jgi:flagellar hook-associated protein 2
MDLRLTGLASGFDWESLVSQLTELERTPQKRLLAEQDILQQRNNAYSSIVTELTVLQSRVEALKEASLFDGRATAVGDATLASATAATGTAVGRYTFTTTQLATASVQQGTANAGAGLNATDDVSGLVLSQAAFASTVTAGTFTVNGRQVSLDTSDTLQALFDKISAATGGAVTANYSSATDTITLSSAAPIVLGSAADTSNFLQAAKLYNNGTGTVASAYALGVVKSSATLTQAHFAVAVTDGGSGAGQFKINGVTFDYNASTDTVASVLARINNSTAGVTANYDAVNDRFMLTNKSTGDLGIALEDVTGNFLAASGLSGGTLNRGKNLLYTVNDGGPLVSQSNTITEASSALAGLSVTILKEGTTTVEVSNDTSKVKTAITDFIDEYNKVQSLIDRETASSTDPKGKVTASILAGQTEAHELASKLRGLANSVVSGLAGTVKQLDHLGIVSNGDDNTLKLSDSAKLDAALTNNLEGVRDLFTNSANGLAVKLGAYLDDTVGDEGTLVTRQSTLNKQIADIDTQVADMERWVLANQERMVQSFVAMETARAKINQQMEFLNQKFAASSS